MEYALIEANATLLADKFTETTPAHIFIGDTNHFDILTTMSCISHPNVLGALKAQNKDSIGVEMGASLAARFFPEARKGKDFGGLSHKESVEKAKLFAGQDSEYAKQIAFNLLLARCDEAEIEINGVDVNQEQTTPEEYEEMYRLALEQFTLMQKIQKNLGAKAFNISWFRNTDLREVWQNVVAKTNPETSPKHERIKDLASMMVALAYLERTKKYSESVEKPRLKHDKETASLIKSTAGSGGSFTIFGDGHVVIPQSLGKGTLHVSVCPAEGVMLTSAKISNILNENTPHYYLNAPDALLVEGKLAQEEVLELIQPYFSLQPFRS